MPASLDLWVCLGGGFAQEEVVEDPVADNTSSEGEVGVVNPRGGRLNRGFA